jgi:hypothetical protein
VQMLKAAPGLAAELTATPSLMHSWRAFWVLLIPDSRVAVGMYLAAAAITVVVAAALWRSIREPSLRMTVLLIATVLASPHLYVYDMVILGPAWIWLIDWYLCTPAVPASVARTLYAGYIAPGLPAIAQVVHVQLSTLCLAALMFWIRGSTRASAASDEAAAGPHGPR